VAGERAGPRYEPHALRRMRQRGISQDDVVAVLKEPDTTYPAHEGRISMVRTLSDGRRIQVVVAQDENGPIVWTVMNQHEGE